MADAGGKPPTLRSSSAKSCGTGSKLWTDGPPQTEAKNAAATPTLAPASRTTSPGPTSTPCRSSCVRRRSPDLKPQLAVVVVVELAAQPARVGLGAMRGHGRPAPNIRVRCWARRGPHPMRRPSCRRKFFPDRPRRERCLALEPRRGPVRLPRRDRGAHRGRDRAFHGKSTNEMLAGRSAPARNVIAVDPAPQPDLTEIAAGHPELELVQATSHDALRAPVPDAIIIDGDHNYSTLSEELRLITSAPRRRDAAADAARHRLAAGPPRRLLRPERIPAEHRQPLAPARSSLPSEPGTPTRGCRSRASPSARVAARTAS